MQGRDEFSTLNKASNVLLYVLFTLAGTPGNNGSDTKLMHRDNRREGLSAGNPNSAILRRIRFLLRIGSHRWMVEKYCS